jgi:hypothetical protein
MVEGPMDNDFVVIFYNFWIAITAFTFFLNLFLALYSLSYKGIFSSSLSGVVSPVIHG